MFLPKNLTVTRGPDSRNIFPPRLALRVSRAQVARRIFPGLRHSVTRFAAAGKILAVRRAGARDSRANRTGKSPQSLPKIGIAW